jgi:hypothetical protein
VLLFEVGGDEFEMAGEPFLVAAGGLGDAHESER